MASNLRLICADDARNVFNGTRAMRAVTLRHAHTTGFGQQKLSLGAPTMVEFSRTASLAPKHTVTRMGGEGSSNGNT